MASSTSTMLLRPLAGSTAAVASTSCREGPALPRRHSRRSFVANAASGDGEGGENNDEQANNRKAAAASIAAAKAAAAAAAVAASSLLVAQPAAASEHPIEGGWRHGLRPRRHLRAMGEFERDRLLRVRGGEEIEGEKKRGEKRRENQGEKKRRQVAWLSFENSLSHTDTPASKAASEKTNKQQNRTSAAPSSETPETREAPRAARPRARSLCRKRPTSSTPSPTTPRRPSRARLRRPAAPRRACGSG